MTAKFDRYARQDSFQGKTIEEYQNWKQEARQTLSDLLGLDKMESGDIIINGRSTNDFSRKDFDAYRNYHIGFIFQEFNSHLNIRFGIFANLTFNG